MYQKENAHPQNPEMSADDKRIFTYPKKTTSACAEILAHLLAGEVLTAADTLWKASTMRAAAHIHYLSSRYNWPILTEMRAVGCADGRLTEVATYRLAADCIQEAYSAGAGAWCGMVRKSRAALRVKSAEASRRAAAINKAKATRHNPNQGNLFGSDKDGE